MKFANKINDLNKYIGFHLYSFLGLFTIIELPAIWLSNTGHLGYNISFDGFADILYLCFLASIDFILITIATWILIFEYVSNKELKNGFILNNKYLKIIRYIGALISTLFMFGYLIIFFSIIIFYCVYS